MARVAEPAAAHGQRGPGSPGGRGLTPRPTLPHSSVISGCPGLRFLNLESCRCLPRGLKRAYRGSEDIQRCLEQLLTSPASPS